MIQVAVIGLGTMGHEHLQGWSRIEQANIAGVLARDAGKAQEVADQYGTKAYADLNQLLSVEEIDVVDVCLPTHLHYDYVSQVAKAGKNIICEKPLGIDVRDAQAIIDVCKTHNVQLYVGHTLRFSPDYVTAHDQIKAGAIGQPGVMRLSRGGPFPHGRDHWYADEDKSGGVILDMVIHDFDWLRWTFGEAKRVMAKRVSQLDDDGVKELEYALITLRMEDGTIAHVEASWARTEFEASFELAGDLGMITHNSNESLPVNLQMRVEENESGPGVAVPESVLGKSPYQRQLEHFTDCLLNDREPIVTAHDALQAVEIARAAIQSAETGQPVHFVQGGEEE